MGSNHESSNAQRSPRVRWQSMKRFLCASALAILIASPVFIRTKAVAQTPATTGPDQHHPLLNIYCVTCHSAKLKSGGLALDGLDLQAAADDAQVWEKA